MKYGKRSWGKIILSSPLTMCVLFVILFVLVRASWNLYKKAGASAVRLSQAQEEFMQLKQRENDLAAKVSTLSTDEGIEAEIRTKFHAVKAGESVAVIVDDQSASAKNALENSQASSTPGWWGRIMRKFGLGR